MRQRAALLAHVQHTNSQYNLPEMGKKSAYNANRAGVAERFDDAAVPKTSEVALALITSEDARRRDLALSSLTTAKPHEANPLSLWQTVPGIGNLLRLVLLSDIHALARCPRVQDCASYGRLGKGAQDSAGKRWGTSGKTIGNAHLKWAFAEAAVLFLRNHPQGQKSLARLEKKHDKGQALTLLAPKLARAVYDLLKRTTAFDMDVVLRAEGSRAGEPAVALDAHGLSLNTGPWNICH